jgi:hypothetical protein
MFLGSDGDLDPGNSSMLDGTTTKGVLNKLAAKPIILGRKESLCGKEADIR